MGHSPIRKPKIVESSPGGLHSGTITCWPRVFLAYAHINKLMIIAKRENHTYRTYNKQQKGKLEPKNSLSCSYLQFHSSRYICQPIMLWLANNTL